MISDLVQEYIKKLVFIGEKCNSNDIGNVLNNAQGMRSSVVTLCRAADLKWLKQQ